jgi:hypothetical protein
MVGNRFRWRSSIPLVYVSPKKMKSPAPQRDPYEIHLFRVFRIKADKLRALCDSDNIDDSLEISAILRHVLSDGNCLADDISRAFGLPCSIPVTDAYMTDGIKVFRTDYSPLNNAATAYNRGDFLGLECIDLDGEVLRVSDLINLIANFGGGVHHVGSANKDGHQAFHLLETDHANTCLEVLQNISRVTLGGLAELRKSVEAQFSFLEQRKRRKQPKVVISPSKENTMSFMGDSSLEAYARLSMVNGGCLLFTLIPSSENEYPSTIMEIGSRATQQKISLQLVDANKLEIRFHRSKNEFSVCSLPYAPLRANILFVNWSISPDKKLKLQCAIRHDRDEYGDIETESYWDAVEGKVVIGQNLNSRNGSVFQGFTFVIFDRLYTLSDFEGMCKTPQLTDEISKKWIHENVVENKGTVIRLYNQTS